MTSPSPKGATAFAVNREAEGAGWTSFLESVPLGSPLEHAARNVSNTTEKTTRPDGENAWTPMMGSDLRAPVGRVPV